MRVISAADVAVLLGDWSAGGSGSLSRRLAYALRSRIAANLLAPGTRLPSERALAAALAVSRATLTVALDELRGEGVLISRQGSGTSVAGAPSEGQPGAPIVVDRLRGSSTAINLSAADPPGPVHLPALTVTNDDLLTVTPAQAYDPLGLPRLRQAIARRYHERQLPTRVDSVLITHGAQQAIAAAVSLLSQPGETFVVEDPTYPGVFDALRARGVQPIAVPRDKEGVDPSALREAIRRYRPSGAFVMSGVHNPTGSVTAERRRSTIAELVDELALPVVEDNVLDELVFDGGRLPLLAALCSNTTVLSVGSPSKVAWDGFRVGWLRGPRDVVERGARSLAGVQLSASVPAQLLVISVLASYDELAERRRSQLARDAASLAEMLESQLPDWAIVRPDGGLALWVKLPRGTGDALAQRAFRHGVSVAPGSACSEENGASYIRLCFDRSQSELTEGVDRLVSAWREI